MKPADNSRSRDGFTFSEILVSSGVFWVVFIVIMLIVNH